MAKENYSRIPLDVPKEYHQHLKDVAKQNGMTLNGFIKKAIEEKLKENRYAYDSNRTNPRIL